MPKVKYIKFNDMQPEESIEKPKRKRPKIYAKSNETILKELTDTLKPSRFPYNPAYYYLNKLMSYDPKKYFFYIAIGSRGRGKTTSAWRWVLRRFLTYGEMFAWLRLTEAPLKKAKGHQGSTLVPKLVLKQLNILNVSVKGTSILVSYLDKNKKPITRVAGVMDALSTFYTTKGLDHEEIKNIVLDEINKERVEKNSFDVVYAFINEIENIVRMRKVRILMLGNTISDTSEILSIFNFQPMRFGIYKLTRRHCIIEYTEDSPEFKEKRKNSLAGILLRGNEEVMSSFSNIKEGYNLNLKKFNAKTLDFMCSLYMSENTIYNIYNDKETGDLFVGKRREKRRPIYKISPFLNCEGIYSKEVYNAILDTMGNNLIAFETIFIRTNFFKCMRDNRRTLY